MSAITEVWLGFARGANVNGLQLNGVSNGYVLQALDLGTADGERRTIVAALGIRGASRDEIIDRANAIEQLCEAAFRGGAAYGDPLKLSLNVGGVWTYFDLLSGTLPAPSDWLPRLKTGYIPDYVLTVQAAPLGYGDPLDLASFTIDGDTLTEYEADIPGTAPAILDYVVTDNSTGDMVLNGLRLGVHAPRRALDPTGFVGVRDLGPTGAAGTISDAAAYGGSYARLATLPGYWQPVAGGLAPTPLEQQAGTFDLVALVRTDLPAFGDSAPGTPTLKPGGIQRLQVVTASSGAATTTTLTVTLAQAPTAGNLLVLQAVGYSSPNIPAGWTTLTSNVNLGTVLAWRLAGAAEPAGLTVTSLVSNNLRLALLEYRGIASATADSTRAHGNVVDSTTLDTFASLATTQAYELVIAGGALLASATITGVTSGYRQLYGIVAGVNQAVLYEKIASATGTQQLQVTYTPTGRYDATLATFKGKSGSAPDLTAGGYAFVVTAVNADGVESAASGVAYTNSAADTGVFLEWGGIRGGVVDHYRIYWQRDANGWQYVETTGAVTSFDFLSETGGTAGAPNRDNTTYQQWRVQLGAAPTMLTPWPAVAHRVGEDVWGWQVVARAVVVPPLARRNDGTLSGYWTQVEWIGSADANVDVDCLAFVPTDTQLDVSYLPDDLATRSVWALGEDTRGRLYGQLSRGGTAEEALSLVGTATAGPGPVVFVALPRGAGGAVDLAQTSLTVAVRVTPRYRALAGIT